MQESKSWTVGRIAGTPVHVRPGALLLIVIFSALYFSSFEQYASSPAAAIIASVVLGIVLVLSVFLHEVAHVLVAKAFKVDAHEIGLTFFGGHAGFKRSFDKPWHSFLTSVAGPATNLLLALVLSRISAAMSVTADNALMYLVIDIGASMNLLLGIFNLLPGLPLDGGNAVSALVWQFTKKRATGILVAARAGQVVCVAWLGYAIVWPLTQGRSIDTFYLLWTLLIVWVLWSGARSALMYARQTQQFDAIDVAALVSPVILVSADQPITAAGEALLNFAANAAIVVVDAQGKPTGYVDPQAMFAVPADEAPHVTISSVSVPLMAGSVVPSTSSAQDLLSDVRTAQGVRTLYVLEGPTGITGVFWIASLLQVIRIN
jgi:Zn-dependent protease